MRRIIVPGLIIFSALTLSWVGGAFGQRERGVAAATTRTATQVEVTNFPAVQAITGAVNVGNLPAVQAVGGAVAVSNLPLDASGNVRVTPAVPSAPFVLTKIAEGLPLSGVGGAITNIPIGTFSTAGYHRLGFFVRATIQSLDTTWCFRIQPLVTLDGTQFTGYGEVDACSSNVTYTAPLVTQADNVFGPEVTVVATLYSPTDQAVGTANIDAWLYLSN